MRDAVVLGRSRALSEPCSRGVFSKEEEEEKLEDEKKTVINLVEAHSLVQVKLEAKEYKTLMNAYYKDLLNAINKAKEEILFPEGKAPTDKEELKKAEADAIKKVLVHFSSSSLFPCSPLARGTHSVSMGISAPILILSPPDNPLLQQLVVRCFCYAVCFASFAVADVLTCCVLLPSAVVVRQVALRRVPGEVQQLQEELQGHPGLRHQGRHQGFLGLRLVSCCLSHARCDCRLTVPARARPRSYIAAEPTTLGKCMIIPSRYIGESLAPVFYVFVDGVIEEKA